METKVYISYVVQSKESHRYQSEILPITPPQHAVYADVTSQQVIAWAKAKQATLLKDELVVIMNYFPISNYD